MENKHLASVKQHEIALLVIGLLLFMRFVYVPVVDWQDSLVQENTLLQGKYRRVERLASGSEALQNADVQLTRALADWQRLFFEAAPETAFRVRQQRWLEKQVADYNVQLNNIGWEPHRQLDLLGVTQHRATLTVSGKAKNIALFMATLASTPQYIEVSDVALSFTRRGKDKLGAVRGRINVTFYMEGGIDE